MGNAPAPDYACQGKAVSDACSYGYGSTTSSNAGVCTLSVFIHRLPADHRSQRATHLREPVKMRARRLALPMAHWIALWTTLTIEGLGMAAAALLLPGWLSPPATGGAPLALGLHLVSHTLFLGQALARVLLALRPGGAAGGVGGHGGGGAAVYVTTKACLGWTGWASA